MEGKRPFYFKANLGERAVEGKFFLLEKRARL
jgi:hypothetical protein